jgi:hypothetical protein
MKLPRWYTNEMTCVEQDGRSVAFLHITQGYHHVYSWKHRVAYILDRQFIAYRYY